MTNSIGAQLVREGLISATQLARGLALQKQNGDYHRLGDVLISQGLLTGDQLAQFFHPIPQTPARITDTGLSEAFLIDLLLKMAYLETGKFSIQHISTALSLPFSVVNELVELIKADHLASIRSAGSYNQTTQIFELTQRGLDRAKAALEISLYVGAAPVPLSDYTHILERQCIKQIVMDRGWIRNALRHLVVSEKLLNQVGPAFSSGRSIFFYGPPGNGKTSIAEALARGLPGPIYIPQAVEVNGQVIRLYDTAIHAEIPDETTAQLDLKANLKHDPRWKKCHRPVVIVGGELTLDMLDLYYDTTSKFYEAPIHMKAGNGVFILEDFGRQRVEPRHLLNRWIVPLERGTDFPSLHTGMKFEIPFDQITIFCTNLRPKDLVDEAFLRRIRHKILVQHPTEDEFKEIMRRICNLQQLDYDPSVTEYLIDTYYRATGRSLAGSHPRDLVEHIVDYAHFMNQHIEFTRENIDVAAANFFVEM